jgi:GTP-binding protein
MPQTKFVLKKSLELHLKPIVVINKIDRAHARPDEVATLTFDLFCELNATDEQLDFPIVYASGRDGWAALDLDDARTDMKPLLETITHRVLPPIAELDEQFQMLVTMLDYDSYVGRIANGRIYSGSIKTGEAITLIKRDGKTIRSKVTRILKYLGMHRVEVKQALAGDIVSIAGIEDVHVGETLASPLRPEALPLIKIDEPTISMFFSHNTSPLSGKDGGRFLTSRHIRERLAHEAMINVGIRVEDADGGERFKVSGRGELHLAILIETMRREGYEMEVSRPRVILKEADNGLLEPMEEVVIEVDPGYEGTVIDALGRRKAEMRSMTTSAVGTIRMEFLVATRALIGFRSEFLTMTRGTGVMYQNFHEYQAYKGELPRRNHGVQVALHPGSAVAFALWSQEERGEIFIHPSDPVYEGMIIGANSKGSDLVVNAIKEKKLTNMRASGADDAIQLTPPREMTLEFALEFIEDDELVEITPKSVRLRKRILNEQLRKVAAKRPASV